jgi:hypothetical protein
MSIKSNWRKVAVVGAFSLVAATQASAHTIAATSAPANWTFAGAAQVIVPGMTSAPFFNLLNQRFIVTFSSECAVNAPAGNSMGWTDVDVVVLNVFGAVVRTLAPTIGSADAFCAANGTAGFDGWESNSVQAIGGSGLPAGVYRVQVRARLNGGATGGWFGERALVVTR